MAEVAANLRRDAAAGPTPLEVLVLAYQQTRDPAIFDQISRMTEGLLRHAARPVFRCSALADRHTCEVLSAGLVGLWRATLTWRPDLSGFAAHGWRWMNGAIRSYVRQLRQAQNALSLDGILAGDDGEGDADRSNLLADQRTEAPEAGPDREDLQAALYEAVSRICRPREARLIRLRYQQGLRLRELAELEAVTKERARQIIGRGLVRLRLAAARGELPAG